MAETKVQADLASEPGADRRHAGAGLQIGETRSNFLWITCPATYNYGCPKLKYPQPAQCCMASSSAAKNS